LVIIICTIPDEKVITCINFSSIIVLPLTVDIINIQLHITEIRNINVIFISEVKDLGIQDKGSALEII